MDTVNLLSDPSLKNIYQKEIRKNLVVQRDFHKVIEDIALSMTNKIEFDVNMKIRPLHEQLIEDSKQISIRMCSWREKKQKALNSLRQLLRKLKRLDMCIDDYIEENPFPKHPHWRENSRNFFFAVKMNRIREVDEMLIKDRSLIYDIDNVAFVF